MTVVGKNLLNVGARFEERARLLGTVESVLAADNVGPLLAPGILRPSRRIRRLVSTAAGQTDDWKRHAGANTIVNVSRWNSKSDHDPANGTLRALRWATSSSESPDACSLGTGSSTSHDSERDTDSNPSQNPMGQSRLVRADGP